MLFPVLTREAQALPPSLPAAGAGKRKGLLLFSPCFSLSLPGLLLITELLTRSESPDGNPPGAGQAPPPPPGSLSLTNFSLSRWEEEGARRNKKNLKLPWETSWESGPESHLERDTRGSRRHAFGAPPPAWGAPGLHPYLLSPSSRALDPGRGSGSGQDPAGPAAGSESWVSSGVDSWKAAGTVAATVGAEPSLSVLERPSWR